MNKEKTLSENNIKDNDSILLYLNGPTITMTENTTSSSGQNTSKLLNENKNTPKKILISHFNSKKHNHGMVFLFSNNKWVCDICSSFNLDNTPKYYCSLCDFNICQKCIERNSKY